jgi:glycosyltransferase 2 family protein
LANIPFQYATDEPIYKWWPRVKRILAVLLMLAIFAWMIKPVVKDWSTVKPFIERTDGSTFTAACAMFAVFLFARALTWRRILKGFGHDLPLAPSTRIWISSEMARYVPGSVLQFAGRVFLSKPYGVPRAVVITSQILELSAFLLGNVILALLCLLYDVAKIDHEAKPWMILTIALVPILVAFLHPRIFYGLVNAVRARQRKEPITIRLGGKVLTALLFGSLVALVWQSIGLWVLTHGALHLEWKHWWYVAGAYCLAWIAGFLSFLSPGGMGVRELVFYVTLRAILPAHIKDQFGASRATFNAYLKFLAVLLRLWTIGGELILWSISSALDWKGALGRADAPGRVAMEQTPASPQEDRSASNDGATAPASPS